MRYGQRALTLRAASALGPVDTDSLREEHPAYRETGMNGS